jgi:uncharacterized membrane protein
MTLRTLSSVFLLGSWLLTLLWITAFGQLFGPNVYRDGFIGWLIMIIAAVIMAIVWIVLQFLQRKRARRV